jgi:hypothetical protein
MLRACPDFRLSTLFGPSADQRQAVTTPDPEGAFCCLAPLDDPDVQLGFDGNLFPSKPSKWAERTAPMRQVKGRTKNLGRLPGLKFMRTLWVCNVSVGPFQFTATKPGTTPVCTENLIRVDDVMESPKLAE